MAPGLVDTLPSAVPGPVDTGSLKAQVTVNEVDSTDKPPVADDFMYDFKYNHALPTSDALAVEIPADCDAQKSAEGIVARLSEVMGAGNAQAFTDLFLEYGKFCLIPSHGHL